MSERSRLTLARPTFYRPPDARSVDLSAQWRASTGGFQGGKWGEQRQSDREGR
jgi:hypothetical protein